MSRKVGRARRFSAVAAQLVNTGGLPTSLRGEFPDPMPPATPLLRRVVEAEARGRGWLPLHSTQEPCTAPSPRYPLGEIVAESHWFGGPEGGIGLFWRYWRLTVDAIYIGRR